MFVRGAQGVSTRTVKAGSVSGPSGYVRRLGDTQWESRLRSQVEYSSLHAV